MYLTFEACVVQHLPGRVVHVLHSVDDDGSHQDVCETEDVRLLQTLARLEEEGVTAPLHDYT